MLRGVYQLFTRLNARVLRGCVQGRLGTAVASLTDLPHRKAERAERDARQDILRQLRTDLTQLAQAPRRMPCPLLCGRAAPPRHGAERRASRWHGAALAPRCAEEPAFGAFISTRGARGLPANALRIMKLWNYGIFIIDLFSKGAWSKGASAIGKSLPTTLQRQLL